MISASHILRTHLATRSLGASECGVITFPTVLLPRDRYLDVKDACRTTRGKRTKNAPTAEVVRQILCGLGLHAERTRRDTEGTVGLFRNLVSPPPWEEVQIGDTVDGLTPERAEQLTPLYRLKGDETVLVEHYRQALLERNRQAEFLEWPFPQLIRTVEPIMLQFRVDEFITQLRLARLLGPERVECLAEAIFGYEGDECSAAPGVPDLFVWDCEHDPAEWFFAEVKGPKDHLQETQANWLRNHWQDIEGRFAVISVG